MKRHLLPVSPSSAPPSGRSSVPPPVELPALLVVLVLLVLGLVGAACSGGDDGPDGGAADDSGETAPGEGSGDGDGTIPSRDQRRSTIQLGVMDWTGARLGAAIAEQLIERRLGHPVETSVVVDYASMLTDLERGELHAVLELWPSALLESERAIIEAGRVVDLGELGVEGRVGWFVPRATADELGIVDWTSLQDPAVASAFATPGSGGRGRLLGIDPEDQQFDEELVDALGLPFVVEYSGSDAESRAEVDAAVAAGDPILVHWWSPTALVARHDLVPVPLPERTPECLDDMAAGLDAACDYPTDALIKLGSPVLAETAPEVERFLAAFRLGTDDQLALIDQVDNGGITVERAAEGWIEANQATWETWLG